MTSTDQLAQERGPRDIADVFVRMADTLVADYDVADLMDHLVRATVELFDVSAAGLLLLDQRGGLQVVASSSDEARVLELFQLQNEQGPCLDCIATGTPVSVADLGSEGARWPRFVEAAARGGFVSVSAVPLRLRSEVIGGLNMFGSVAGELSEHEQRSAQALADVATIGILQQRSVHRSALLAEQLQSALSSRVVVEQAKGALSQYGGTDTDSAFRALRKHARSHNLKLSEAAGAVVRGEIALDAVLPRGGGAGPL